MSNVTKNSRKRIAEQSASAAQVLRAEQRVHDETAAALMKEAAKHLRVAVRLDKEISRLSPEVRTA